MREGQTIAIAGLYSSETATQNNRVPLLGELPLIGPLFFNAKRATNDETELLILVTPEIVRPMEADEVPPVPGHEVTLPNDPELYRWGMTEGAPDTEVYQLAPYGYGSGTGNPVGYHLFNPGPSQPGYEPAPAAPISSAPSMQNPYGSRYSPATAIPGANGREGWNTMGPPTGPAPRQEGWSYEQGPAGRAPRQEGWQQVNPSPRMPSQMSPQYQQSPPPRLAPGQPYGPGRPAPRLNSPQVYPMSPPPGANYQSPNTDYPTTSQTAPNRVPPARNGRYSAVSPKSVSNDQQIQPASFSAPEPNRGTTYAR